MLAAHGKRAGRNARVISSVAYTDPKVTSVGLTEKQVKAQGIKAKKAFFWTAAGGAIANWRHDRQDCPGHRNGRRRRRHWQNHPSAPHAGRKHRHGGGGSARQLHRPAACAEVSRHVTANLIASRADSSRAARLSFLWAESSPCAGWGSWRVQRHLPNYIFKVAAHVESD